MLREVMQEGPSDDVDDFGLSHEDNGTDDTSDAGNTVGTQTDAPIFYNVSTQQSFKVSNYLEKFYKCNFNTCLF